MTDINTQQIEEKLNQRFPNYGCRKIIFGLIQIRIFLKKLTHWSFKMQNLSIRKGRTI